MKAIDPVTGTISITLSETELWTAAELTGAVHLWNTRNGWQPATIEEKARAIEGLIQQNLFHAAPDGKMAPEFDLARLLDICRQARAIVLFQTYNDLKEEVVYHAGAGGVLQSPCGDGVVELVEMPNLATLVAWFAGALRLTSDQIGKRPAFDMPADVFIESQQLRRVKQLSKAKQRLADAAIPADLLARLENALSSPISQASVVRVGTQNDEPAGSGFFLLEAEQDFWLINLLDGIAHFEPASAGRVRCALKDLMRNQTLPDVDEYFSRGFSIPR